MAGEIVNTEDQTINSLWWKLRWFWNALENFAFSMTWPLLQNLKNWIEPKNYDEYDNIEWMPYLKEAYTIFYSNSWWENWSWAEILVTFANNLAMQAARKNLYVNYPSETTHNPMSFLLWAAISSTGAIANQLMNWEIDNYKWYKLIWNGKDSKYELKNIWNGNEQICFTDFNSTIEELRHTNPNIMQDIWNNSDITLKIDPKTEAEKLISKPA